MKIFIYLILFLSLSSCNQKEKIDEETVREKSEYSNLTVDLNNKPKLFLKFWANMSEKEFDTIVNILIKDKVLERENYSNLFYLTPKCKVNINPKFVNDSLKEIELSNGLCLYENYREKYNLPALLEKRLVDYRRIEKNLEYNPTMTYYGDNGVVNLPDCFQDKSDYNISSTKDLPIDENGPKEKMLSKTPIIIEKDDCVIFLAQSFYEVPSPIITYSLDLSADMDKYKLDHPLVYLSPEGKYISKNSKFKIVEKISSSVIKITYKSKFEYQKELRKSNQLKQQLESESHLDNELKTKRNEAVRNEI